MSPNQVISILKQGIKRAGSQEAYGKEIGISQTTLSLTISGKRGIPDSILNALGLRRKVTIERKDTP